MLFRSEKTRETKATKANKTQTDKIEIVTLGCKTVSPNPGHQMVQNTSQDDTSEKNEVLVLQYTKTLPSGEKEVSWHPVNVTPTNSSANTSLDGRNFIPAKSQISSECRLKESKETVTVKYFEEFKVYLHRREWMLKSAEIFQPYAGSSAFYPELRKVFEEDHLARHAFGFAKKHYDGEHKAMHILAQYRENFAKVLKGIHTKILREEPILLRDARLFRTNQGYLYQDIFMKIEDDLMDHAIEKWKESIEIDRGNKNPGHLFYRCKHCKVGHSAMYDCDRGEVY